MSAAAPKKVVSLKHVKAAPAPVAKKVVSLGGLAIRSNGAAAAKPAAAAGKKKISLAAVKSSSGPAWERPPPPPPSAPKNPNFAPRSVFAVETVSGCVLMPCLLAQKSVVWWKDRV